MVIDDPAPFINMRWVKDKSVCREIPTSFYRELGQWAERAGVNLADCTFYSDHVADLPLLEAVGTPVAVGPNRALERVARARGYRILPHDGMLAA